MNGQVQRRFWVSFFLCVLVAVLLVSCGDGAKAPTPTSPTPPTRTPKAATPDPVIENAFPREEGVGIVITRALAPNTEHGIALVDMDPESETFGTILNHHFIKDLKEPPHHLYYSPAGRLYATVLDTEKSLMEIKLERDATGMPVITDVVYIPTGGQQVGEDMIWRTVNGQERFYVTFMGGDGSDQLNVGGVGYFNAASNELLGVIEGKEDPADPDKPFIKFPHGITAYENYMVVASCISPDLASGIGNTITLIDMKTDELLETYLVADNKEHLSSPVEVLFLRPEIHANFTDPGLLVSTMFGHNLWYSSFDTDKKRLGEFKKIFVGEDHGVSFPLEFYGNSSKAFGDELFLSWCVPGVVKRFDMAKLPELVENEAAPIESGAGAHHMFFFTTASGREVIGVQNNLLNLGTALGPDLSANTVTIHDIATGEKLGTIDFENGPAKCAVEYVDAIFGSGYAHHH